MVAYLCRFGNQDAHRLLGVEVMSRDQRKLLAHHINLWMEKEVQPLQGPDTITIDDD